MTMWHACLLFLWIREFLAFVMTLSLSLPLSFPSDLILSFPIPSPPATLIFSLRVRSLTHCYITATTPTPACDRPVSLSLTVRTQRSWATASPWPTSSSSSSPSSSPVSCLYTGTTPFASRMPMPFFSVYLFWLERSRKWHTTFVNLNQVFVINSGDQCDQSQSCEKYSRLGGKGMFFHL